MVELCENKSNFWGGLEEYHSLASSSHCKIMWILISGPFAPRIQRRTCQWLWWYLTPPLVLIRENFYFAFPVKIGRGSVHSAVKVVGDGWMDG